MKVMLVKSVTVNKKLAEKAGETEIINPELFKILKAVRYDLATQENVPSFVIFSDATLVELAAYLPLTSSALARISGFGDIKLVKYGNYFLDAITDYCMAHNLTTKIDSKVAKKKTKTSSNSAADRTDTKTQSLQLFQSGKSVGDIASERGFALSTIEGHLAHFVFSGELDVNQIVNKEKMLIIAKSIEENNNTVLSSIIKQQLGDGYSYGEISAVIHYKRRMNEA